jgi:hypothetical protein
MNAPLTHPVTGEAEVFADGLYFGLDEDVYHADPAMGSTRLKLLLGDPAAFWWEQSGLDPQKDSPFRQIGRAVHRFVLEGRERFEAAYGRAELNGATKAGKEESEAIAEAGKIRMKAEDYDRVASAGALIRANPNVAKAFTGGMPEVSVFWTVMIDGVPVRRKARFDYLKVRSIVDLKSCAPFADWTFGATWRRAMKFWRYPIQAAAYMEGRAELPRLVSEGMVFGDHDPAWLAQVCAAEAYAFSFVFWASSGAPLTGGGYFSPGNAKLAEGHDLVARALTRYVQFSREFGPDRAWIVPEDFAEIDPIEIDEPWRANELV